MKTCNDCNEIKDDFEFNKNQLICKKCKNIRHKEYYARRKQLFIDRNKQRREKFRKIISEIKHDLYCEKCGENHEAVLDFHHIKSDDKNFTISSFASEKYPSKTNVKILKEEIKKCKVLCSNCHRKLHWYETRKK